MTGEILQTESAIYVARDLTRLAWLEHGFGTGDGWPEPSRLAMLEQIHSAVVVRAEGCAGYLGEGDALITNQPGLMVGVRTADCVPILLADRSNHAVAAVHAGWRGSAANIVERTLETMESEFRTDPRDVSAAIGPCIGLCCYEVGGDVAEQFLEWLPELKPRRKQHLELAEVNRRQLRRAGVVNKRISSGAPCTFCSKAGLHSYRRDGRKAGRMISAIGIHKAGARTKGATVEEVAPFAEAEDRNLKRIEF